MRNLLFGTVLIVASGIAAGADSDLHGDAAARHNDFLKHVMLATYALYEEFGAAYRATAGLKLCKLDALAKAVEPSKDAEFAVLISYEREHHEFRDDDPMLVLAAVRSSIDYYGIGFKEAAEITLGRDQKAFCESITNVANQVLEERSKSAAPSGKGDSKQE